jgi:hypothetical protein
VGSAFYGLYFLASYPLFFDLDEPPESTFAIATAADSASAKKPSTRSSSSSSSSKRGHANVFSLRRCVLEALGAGMVVLMLLDGVRVFWVKSDLTVALRRPCKLDPGLTCAPFTGAPC